MPTFHEPRRGSLPPDLIVHVGVGGSGRLTLEQRGRRLGYEQEDAGGELCEAGEDGRRGAVGERWGGVCETGEGGEEEVRTKVDGAKVLEFVKRMGVDEIAPSEDAGECGACSVP